MSTPLDAFAALAVRARSYRRFDASVPIPGDVVRRLVDIARISPCASNQQPLRYRVVTSSEECAGVFVHTRWAGALKDWGGPTPEERATAYIVACSPSATASPDRDLGIACEVIQLAATAAGFGACMLGAIKHDEIRQALGIQPQWAVRLVLALGKPTEKVVLEELPASGDVKYWRTPDQVHHVPKRSLEDVLL